MPKSRDQRAAAAGRVGVWDWDLATDEIYLDPILKEILGYEDHEIRNHLDDWGSLVHPEDADEVLRRANAHISGEAPIYQCEHRMLHRDGSVRWFLARGTVTRDADGRAVTMLGTDVDITEIKSREAALRQAEEINKRIVESSNDCIKILDLEGRLLHINTIGLRLLEVDDAAELLNRSILSFYDDAFRTAAKSAVAAAAKGESAHFNGSSRSRSGRMRWWDVAMSPITAADGSVLQVLAISRDVTTQRREEQFRAVQHRMLEKIASGNELPDVLEGLVHLIEQYSRDTFCSILRLDDDGQTIRHAAAPSLPGEYVRLIDGIGIGPRVGSCGTAMYLGKRVIVEDILTSPLWEGYHDVAEIFGLRACWSTPIFSAEQQVVGSFAIYAREPREPTSDELELMESAAYFARVAIEQHRSQQALRRSEARNRAILRAIPDWMFLITPDGVYLDYHALDPSLLYAPPSTFLGKNIREIMPSPLGEELARAVERASKSAGPVDVEYSLGSGDEERFYETSLVQCDGDKVLSIVRDVTEHKRAQLESAVQRAELAHLSRVATLGELTGALAHELSQPLFAMRTNAIAARMMLDSAAVDIPELRGVLNDIISNNRRAGEVVERLRALLRKEKQKSESVDLNDIVREVVDLAYSEIVARGVSIERSSSGGSAVISGDRVQLQQVVLNLILNACDAMSGLAEGDRRLLLKTESRRTFVELDVVDSGVGLAEENLERVFEPFVTFRHNGLGLGLAISRSIVVAHQGSICAINNENGGATFRCRFPLVDATVPQSDVSTISYAAARSQR